MNAAPPAAPPPASVANPASPTGRWPRVLEHGLMLVLGACLVLLAQAAWRRLGTTGRPTAALTQPPVDLNRADRGTLAQLPGVGPHLADRIVTQRDARGPFTSPDDLRQVPGIGPARL